MSCSQSFKKFPKLPERTYQKEGSTFTGAAGDADKPLSSPRRNKERPPAVITHLTWREPFPRCCRPATATHATCRIHTPGLSKPWPGQRWYGLTGQMVSGNWNMLLKREAGLRVMNSDQNVSESWWDGTGQTAEGQGSQCPLGVYSLYLWSEWLLLSCKTE